MRKILLVSLSMLVAVLGAAFAITWYVQSVHTKKSIEEAIARINEAQPYLTYETIEISGFPTHVTVSLINPHFSGRVDEFLKTLAKDPAAFATMPQWSEDVVLTGRLTISVNALSSRYSVSSSGNWRSSGTIGGQPVALENKQSGDTLCTWELARGTGLFGMMWSLDTARDITFEDIRLIDCSAPASVTTDPATQQTLASSGGMRFYLQNTPQGSERQVRIFVISKDMEITQASDRILALYAGAFSPSYRPSSFAAYGKQNLEMDFSYNGPLDFKAQGKDSPFEANLATFSVTNQLYDVHATFGLKNVMAGTQRQSRVQFKAESSFNELYTVKMQDMLRGLIAEMQMGADPRLAAGNSFLQTHTPEETYSILSPTLPNLPSLGKLVQSLDVSYDGNREFTEGNVALTTLEFSAAPYGLTGQGTAQLKRSQLLPDANVVLTCRNCLRMTDDAVAYGTRVQAALAILEPTQAPSPINPRLADGIRAFLTALGQPDAADGTTLAFNITSGVNGIGVNGRSMPDVMGLYSQHVGALLQETPAQP